MSLEFRVSVVIPVYNAATFVERAIGSALAQKETDQIVIVDDGSTDDSYEICNHISKGNLKIRTYKHPGGVNKGIAATRNLAIKHCTNQFVAFLDADDYYLHDRFKVARVKLETDPTLDGVYEAVGFAFDSEEGKQRWSEAGRTEQSLITINHEVDSQNLFRSVFSGKNGYFHFNGLTLRRTVFDKTGYENEEIIYGEDTDYMYRLAASAKMAAGRLGEPVAMRIVHDHNTITTPRLFSEIYDGRLKQRVETWRWLKSHNFKEEAALMLGNILMHGMRDRNSPSLTPNWIPRIITKKLGLVRLASYYSDVILEKAFWSSLVK